MLQPPLLSVVDALAPRNSAKAQQIRGLKRNNATRKYLV